MDGFDIATDGTTAAAAGQRSAAVKVAAVASLQLLKRGGAAHHDEVIGLWRLFSALAENDEDPHVADAAFVAIGACVTIGGEWGVSPIGSSFFAPPSTPSAAECPPFREPCALISSGSRRGDRYNQDNIAGSIPTWLRNLATKKALPSYIKLLQTQCHNQARRPWLPAHGCC